MNRERKEERILSVVFDPEFALCVEFGDEKVDREVYGYGPTQDFVRALAKEIGFQMGNTIGEHLTLKRVQRRFQQGGQRGKAIEETNV